MVAGLKLLRGTAFRLALVLAVVSGAGCVMVGTRPPTAVAPASPEARAAAHEAVLDQVWRLVDRRFYAVDFNGSDWAAARGRYGALAREAEDTAALYEVINAMLEGLDDSHTGVLTPTERWERLRAERAFVGLNLEWLEPAWVVSEVRPGSAAEAAGIESGWLALSRDGLPLPEGRFDLRTEDERDYTWAFLDLAGERRELRLRAQRLPDLMPAEEKVSDEGWVYLRFDEFMPGHGRWLRDRLRAHAAASGVILDLRRNGGGQVSTLERIMADVMPERTAYGTFVSRAGRRAESKSAWLGGARYAGPLVVLVGAGTASSAEILAQAVQDAGRGVIIGRPTAGVVIASRFFPLRDGGELQLGIWDFITSYGRRLEGEGVVPDIAVERRLADLRQGIDADLDAAVRWLRWQRAAAGAQNHQPVPGAEM
jgi:carboxyl-terminal processing protease